MTINDLPYGVAPDTVHHDDVVTAQQLWEAIQSEFDPNDVWTADELGPLLRTFTAVLTRRRETTNPGAPERCFDDCPAGGRYGNGNTEDCTCLSPAIDPTADGSLRERIAQALSTVARRHGDWRLRDARSAMADAVMGPVGVDLNGLRIDIRRLQVELDTHKEALRDTLTANKEIQAELDSVRASREAWVIEAMGCDDLAERFLSWFSQPLTAAAKATGISVSPGLGNVLPALESLAAERDTTRAEVVRLTRDLKREKRCYQSAYDGRERAWGELEQISKLMGADEDDFEVSAVVGLVERYIDQVKLVTDQLTRERDEARADAQKAWDASRNNALCYDEMLEVKANREATIAELERKLTSRPAIPADAHIVCISGSMRFEPEMREAARHESVAGHIVVMPNCNMKLEHPLWATEEDADRIKTNLDGLHFRKIDIAHEVLVVAPGGYVGDSTKREIAYAEKLGKSVRYWPAETGGAA